MDTTYNALFSTDELEGPAWDGNWPKVASDAFTMDSPLNKAIAEACDLLVKAAAAELDRLKQDQILDLIEIFREYLEKGSIKKVSAILANEITHMESASQKLEATARQIAPKPTTRPQVNPKGPSAAVLDRPNGPKIAPQLKTTQNQTYAAAAESANPDSDWILVNSAKKSSPLKLAIKKPLTSRRVILIKDTMVQNNDFQPLTARNALNRAFASKGVKDPVVLLVSKSFQANLVVTTIEAYSADFLLAKSDIWMHLMPGYTAQKDVTWHKIVAHGIPTSVFNCPEGMELVKDEIRTFNKGLTPLGQPYWITSAENRLK
ncbi:hypothetical protein LHYA1_G009165, partial [Lachnellula hyalina]